MSCFGAYIFTAVSNHKQAMLPNWSYGEHIQQFCNPIPIRSSLKHAVNFATKCQKWNMSRQHLVHYQPRSPVIKKQFRLRLGEDPSYPV